MILGGDGEPHHSDPWPQHRPQFLAAGCHAVLSDSAKDLCSQANRKLLSAPRMQPIEASPGPIDSLYLFERFAENMREAKVPA